jgi:hypothetical protein
VGAAADTKLTLLLDTAVEECVMSDHRVRAQELEAEAVRVEALMTATDSDEDRATLREIALHWRELAVLHLRLLPPKR